MGSLAQNPPEEPQRLFQWTVCAYRRPDMSEEDYHQYMSEKHGPLVKGLMVKYGIVKFSMARPPLYRPVSAIHNTSEARKMIKSIAGPQFDNHADYDCFVQAHFRDLEDFVRMKADPYFKEVIGPDHEKFADTKRSRMTIGWVDNHVLDGKVVE